MPSSVLPRSRGWRLRSAVVLTTALAAGVALGTPAMTASAATPNTLNVSAAVDLGAPTGLKVDGLDRPADLEDLASPTFSWQLPSIKRQSAYRIVVSSTQAKAEAHDGDVWDSGDVASAQQTDVAYAGPALESSHRYFWSVQVSDGSGTALDFAEPSWFGTSPGSTWADASPIWSPSPTAAWTDYTVSGKLTPTATALGIRFRAVDANNSYMWQFRGSDNRLTPHKQTNGTYATFGASVALPTGTLAVGKQVTFKIQVVGSTITTFIDDVQVDQRTDSAFASGLVGVRTGNSETGTLDDLKVTAANGATLFSDDFTGANPMACGTVSSGVLNVPVASNCLLAGYGNDWVMARKDVQVEDKPIAWASLFATGTDWSGSKQYVYKAAIDGTFVGLGPTAPTGSETRFDGFDVTSLLKQGTTSTVSLVAHSNSSNARLLAELRIHFVDGTEQVVGTGADWKALSAAKVFPSSGSFGTSYFSAPREDLDARTFPTGYDKPGFDDSAWTGAEVRSTIASLQAAPMGKVTEQLRDAAKITERAAGDYVVDFGRTWMGGIDWDVAAGTAGTKVQVRFGQVLNTDGTVKYATAAGNNYLDTITLRDGAQHLQTWGMRTFRYVEIVGTPEPVTTDSLKALALVYPFDEEASAFDSSDSDLNQVYALSKNTIESTNLNFYTDSYERERTDYEADAYLQLMSSLYLMDDLSLGRYSMNYFKSNRTWPTEWPVYVVLAVHDAWRQTGNTEQVSDYYANLQTKLTTPKWFNASTGLVGKSTGSNGCNSTTDCDIVDWPTTERDGYSFKYYNTVINSISYAALVDMSEMAKAIGKDDDAASYAQQAQALRTAINAKFYNATTGAYDDGADVNGTLTGHTAVQASAFALAFGVPDEDQRAKVASFVASKGMVCSVYCAAFLIKGLYDGGNGQAALDMLTTGTGVRSWMNMIKVGAGATMEAWDTSLKSNLTYSHPWAASPAFNVPSGLFGIQPETAGYESVAIKPTPGDLQWGTIKTPTVRGSVGAAFSQSAAGTAVVASIPGNTSGTVSVPTTATEPTTFYVDGAARTLTPAVGYVKVSVTAGCHVVSPAKTVDELSRLTSVCAQTPTVAANETATISNAGTQGWYGDGATLTLTRTGEAADAGVVEAVEYRLGDGSWTTYDAPVALPAGSYDVAWRLTQDSEVVASGTEAVKVDTVLPTVTSSVLGRRVTLTGVDADSGIASVEYQVDGGDWATYSSPVVVDSGAHTVAYRATDVAGNGSSSDSVQVTVAPSATVAVSGAGEQGWFGADAQLSLSVTGDSAGDAIAEYRLGDGSWTTYDAPVALPAGSYDAAWRVRQGEDVVASGTVPVKVDTVLPTVTAVVSGRRVTLTGTDADSGIASIAYRVDGGGWTAYEGPVLVDTGAHTVSYRAADVAGNASAVASAQVTVAPTATVAVSDAGAAGWFGADAKLSVTVTGDSAGDAIAEYRTGDGSWTTYHAPVALAAGSYDVAWRVRQGEDVVDSGTVPVKVDTVLPTVTASLADRAVTVVATDADSGVATTEVSVDGGPWTAYAEPIELDRAAHTVAYRASDVAGNASTEQTLDVAAVGASATVAPTVTGTARYGARLTATPGRWDTDVTTAYQWLRNGAAIRGATGRTYTLGAADVGTRVSVRVTAAPTVGAAGTATSRSTSVVQRAVSRTTVKVTRKTLRRGQKETVVITVSGAGAATSGQVRIWRPGAKPVVRALSHGTVRLTFKVKGHGRAKVSAQFLGIGVLAPGARTTATYRVR